MRGPAHMGPQPTQNPSNHYKKTKKKKICTREIQRKQNLLRNVLGVSVVLSCTDYAPRDRQEEAEVPSSIPAKGQKQLKDRVASLISNERLSAFWLYGETGQLWSQ